MTEILRTGDALEILPTLGDEEAQIILADPPYNIGKDFGNNSDKQSQEDYLRWTDRWIAECMRILKPNGTMFIFGFSETLALILARLPSEWNRRWLVWYYTNKNVASLNFWQRAHESILVLWKKDKVFHRDAVREPYTDGYLKGAAGKTRAATAGRFSDGNKTTIYNAHPAGALPRDVIRIPALAGGAGAKERVAHPTQKPLALCERLLRSCAQGPNGGYVLVPFAGSGSECVAAKRLGLPFIGIEMNPDYVALAESRLSAGEEKEDTSHSDKRTEVQAHGFSWEKNIIMNVYQATEDELEKIKYNSKMDLPANLNRLDKCDISVKTTSRANAVCMADCLRVFDMVNSDKPIHLVVIHYFQDDTTKTKNISGIIEIDLTNTRSLLFGTLTRSQLEELDKVIKSIPQKRKPTTDEYKNMYSIRDFLQPLSGAIHLDIKCNSTQSRLQCSFNHFQQFVNENPSKVIAKSDTHIFRNGTISSCITSSRRIFKKKLSQ